MRRLNTATPAAVRGLQRHSKPCSKAFPGGRHSCGSLGEHVVSAVWLCCLGPPALGAVGSRFRQQDKVRVCLLQLRFRRIRLCC